MIVPTHEVKNSIAIEINPKDDDGQYFFSTDNQTTQFNIDPATYADDSPVNNKQTFRQKMQHFIDSNGLLIGMSVITIYALFGDDIRLCGFTKEDDDVFFALATVCFFFFSAEFVLCCIFKDNFLWSFYFWLDLISTLSLIPDIGWLYEAMIGADQGGSSSSQASQIQKSSKASRAGTRTSRIVRIIRLVRLIRIVRLYKSASKVINNSDSDNEDGHEEAIPKESQVGKKLSDLTIKRVIILVLVLLFFLPLFDTEFYLENYHSWSFGIDEVVSFVDKDDFEIVRQAYIDYHADDIRPIVYFTIDMNETYTYTWESDTDYTKLRYNEQQFESSGDAISIFDTRNDVQLSSMLNIFQTIFVCIVLTLGAIYFTKDSTDLVITPMENMVERVRIIAKNPLAASQKRKETIYDMIVKDNKKKCLCFGGQKTENEGGKYETALLENTIVKIGALLALGFGEAGSNIIAHCMQKAGDLELLKGSKMVAIFGFCDIRNFTDATEELQEGVMVFVNEIARIVHGMVDTYHGAANKNIGDAFLLVWKFSNKDFKITETGVEPYPESQKAKYVPDLSLLSFLKIMAKINKDPVILKYRTNEKLNIRMPNYEVKMGFGLHIGWAIEGAIGSTFKIDASYLSPHVNMASRFEAATKQYGVPILFSGSLYDLLSPPVKDKCRHIDTITVKGSTIPIRIYTSDCEFGEFVPTIEKERTKEQSNEKRRLLRKKLESGALKSYELYDLSKEIVLMKKNFTPEFYKVFNEGMRAYVDGRWRNAKDKIEECLKIKPRDGPCITLLNVMAETEFEAPSDWDGYRVLTEK